MNRFVLDNLLIVPALIVALCTSGLSEPTSRGPSQESPFVIGRATHQLASPHKMQEVVANWPVFSHRPFESSGLNHLTLPFRFKDDTQDGCQEEAFAFSFLMSNSLDWMPGAYCTRHAYFVFKRSRDEMMGLVTNGYTLNVIESLVQGWGASHAIGGELRRHDDGYSGVLNVFDATGEDVFSKVYEQPYGYFELLGLMACDVMRFFGHEPSAELIKHLKMKRCENHQSIIDLGKAAFIEERSGEEFKLYRKLLERDPGFADARYWIGNQGGWVHQNGEKQALQKALVLDSYLVLEALRSFSPSDCPDKNLAAKYNDWIQAATKLVGEESPTIHCINTFREYKRKECLPRDMIVQATKTVREYPNSFWLCAKLEDAYEKYNKGPSDPAMSVSLTLVALRSRYVTSSTKSQITMFSDLGVALLDLGYNDVALQYLEKTLRYYIYKKNESSIIYYSKSEFVNENETRILDDYAAFSFGLLIHAASGISGG